jgi:23S rRNA (adenine2030-N6)-methyltransferase
MRCGRFFHACYYASPYAAGLALLSYRHLFHAGNFADVFKHALLARLLMALSAKEKPYLYLDTHAGIAHYDLRHPWAQKAREYENGIGRLWKAPAPPPLLEHYLDIVRALNPDGKLRFYPGSPLVAKRFQRPGDRMVLVELNPTDHEALRTAFAHEKRVAVELLDGYQSLRAYLPPAERRGLVLIDSPFDRSREFDRLLKAMKEAHARWPTGVYAIWYPLMEPATIRDFCDRVERSGIRKVLRLELVVRERDESRIIPGCGMLVVNPPWHFDSEARSIVRWLATHLAVTDSGSSLVQWLVPE